MDHAVAAEGQTDLALLDGDPPRAALLLGAAVALRGLAVTGEPDVARVAVLARERPRSAGRTTGPPRRRPGWR